MAVLPKKSALTSYSYRLSHDHQQRFLAALDTTMIEHGPGQQRRGDLRPGLPRRHALGPRPRPGKALRANPFPARPVRADASSPRTPAPTTWSTPTPTSPRPPRPAKAIAFCDHWNAASGHDPAMLIMDQKVTTHQVLGELDAARRQVPHPADALPAADPAHQRPPAHGLQDASPWTGPARTTSPASTRTPPPP